MARPRGDISERLIKAAREAFLTQGVDGASLREIAAEAGTSLGMITYYFPTKDDLFLAVLERVYPKLMADLAVAIGGDADLREKIERLYRHLHCVTDEEFAVVRILIREALVSSARLKKLFARFTGAGGHVPLMMSLVAQGQKQGALRTDLAPLGLLVAAIALGMLPMVVRRRLGELGAGVPTPEVAASVMSAILFEGIGATPKTGVRPKPARPVRRRGKSAWKA
jgi:AcrR family transcriptional regulator